MGFRYENFRWRPTIIRSPKIFEMFVTIENELPNSSSGMSSITIPRSKSGVSSVVPGGRTGVARVTRTNEAPSSSSLSLKSKIIRKISKI